MPNKTIYVKESDLPLFEQAQEQLGVSVSALFSAFLNERIAHLTPEETRIISVIEQISKMRETVRADSQQPNFIDGVYAEAQGHAEKAIKLLRGSQIRDAKISFWMANAYLDLAERNVKEVKALNAKITAMLEASPREHPSN